MLHADDEEGPDWLSMVDNTALGHRLIIENFGTAALPNVTWQIDPFGHSSMQQQLSSPSAGFGGVTTARIDIQDFVERVLTGRLEWVWQTSPSLGTTSQVQGSEDGAHHVVNEFPDALVHCIVYPAIVVSGPLSRAPHDVQRAARSQLGHSCKPTTMYLSRA
jgi:hypothetical protein